MIAGDIIKARLEEVAAVYSQIGGAPPNTRAFKFWLPENPVYPAVAFRRVGVVRLQGTYGDPGYAKVTVQVISFAKTADAADALDEQIRLALERFGSSQPAGIPYAGATLYDIEIGSTADGWSDEVQAFFVSTDYTVHHLETTP